MQQILTIPKAAEKFGVSRWTVWRWVRDGIVPYGRLPGSGRVYFRDSDLETIERVSREHRKG